MRTMPDDWGRSPLWLGGPRWWNPDRQERFMAYVHVYPGRRSYRAWKAVLGWSDNDYETALVVLGHIRIQEPRRSSSNPFRQAAKSRLWPVEPPEPPYPELAEKLQRVLQATYLVQHHPAGEYVEYASHMAIKAILVEAARRREGIGGDPHFDYGTYVDEFLDALDENGLPRPAPNPVVAFLRRVQPMPDLHRVDGVGQATAAKLQAGGVEDVYDLAVLDLRRNVEVPGVGRDALRRYRDQARRLLAKQDFPFPPPSVPPPLPAGDDSPDPKDAPARRRWTWRRPIAPRATAPDST